MTDIKRYIEGKSQAELLEIQRNSVVDGDIYKAATFEIQRIQQDTNNIQIANLIEEIKNLKDITKINADTSKEDSKSSKRVAVAAFIVAVISLLFIILQTPVSYNHQCNYTGTAALKNQTVQCSSELRIGAQDFNWGDATYHDVKY